MTSFSDKARIAAEERSLSGDIYKFTKQSTSSYCFVDQSSGSVGLMLLTKSTKSANNSIFMDSAGNIVQKNGQFNSPGDKILSTKEDIDCLTIAAKDNNLKMYVWVYSYSNSSDNIDINSLLDVFDCVVIGEEVSDSNTIGEMKNVSICTDARNVIEGFFDSIKRFKKSRKQVHKTEAISNLEDNFFSNHSSRISSLGYRVDNKKFNREVIDRKKNWGGDIDSIFYSSDGRVIAVDLKVRPNKCHLEFGLVDPSVKTNIRSKTGKERYWMPRGTKIVQYTDSEQYHTALAAYRGTTSKDSDVILGSISQNDRYMELKEMLGVEEKLNVVVLVHNHNDTDSIYYTKDDLQIAETPHIKYILATTENFDEIVEKYAQNTDFDTSCITIK